jgi:hypothetical protein
MLNFQPELTPQLRYNKYSGYVVMLATVDYSFKSLSATEAAPSFKKPSAY